MSDAATPTVLVIEDDQAVRDLLTSVLAADGFDVQTAADGLEGLLRLRDLRPAVVLLDIMMPDVGGMRVLDELAEQGSGVPVVVVTGDGRAATEASGRLGAANVFGKPFDVDALLARVRALAAGAAGAAGAGGRSSEEA